MPYMTPCGTFDLPMHSGELRHGTCHFYTIYTGVSKIISVYGNLKDQIKLDLCICEALSYMTVPWKPHLWAYMAINYHYYQLSQYSTKGSIHESIWKNQQTPTVLLLRRCQKS